MSGPLLKPTEKGWRCEGGGFFATAASPEGAQLLWHQLSDGARQAALSQREETLKRWQAEHEQARRRHSLEYEAFWQERREYERGSRPRYIGRGAERREIRPQSRAYVFESAPPARMGDEAVIRTSAGVLARVWLHPSGWLVQVNEV